MLSLLQLARFDFNGKCTIMTCCPCYDYHHETVLRQASGWREDTIHVPIKVMYEWNVVYWKHPGTNKDPQIECPRTLSRLQLCWMKAPYKSNAAYYNCRRQEMVPGFDHNITSYSVTRVLIRAPYQGTPCYEEPCYENPCYYSNRAAWNSKRKTITGTSKVPY